MDTQSKMKALSSFIRHKLSASVITIVTFLSLMILTVCIFWYTMTHALGSYLSQQTEVLGSSLATQAAFNATQSILNNDLLSLNVLLNRLVVDDNILSARVYNKKDELLAEADSSSNGMKSEQDYRPSDVRSVYSSSIKFRDEVVGHVLITLNKTPAQDTLKHLNNLLIGVAIFLLTIALLLISIITKWLFAPINDASLALIEFSRGRPLYPLRAPAYQEIHTLFNAVHAIQSHTLPKEIDNTQESVETQKDNPAALTKSQFEINFDAIFEESKKRSCVLYFDIRHLDQWHNDMTPLQVSNLLTPIYRAIFQASELYLGQVHQYKKDSVIVLFSAQTCEDNLYINAVSTAQLFLGLVDKLLENELYNDIPVLNFHLGLHQGNALVAQMITENRFEEDKIKTLLNNIQHLSQSESVNKLVITDEIFTLSHIQNRVFTSLPEIIEDDNNNEILAYEVKGMSDKYKQQIHQQIINIIGPECVAEP